jgi:hypothetical protein
MTHVYDKAKWHYNGDYPADLDIEQAYVHTGLYVTWLARNDLLGDWLVAEQPAGYAAARSRSNGPIDLYKLWDGCLIDDMLTAEGNAFSKEYFDFKTGQYLTDYEALLGDAPDLYRLEPSWENYDRLAASISSAYKRWKKSPFWKFWG